ncbi:MAG: DUF2817 domain-containing protein [Alphaproteobacteria bacterium]|nr:DUF2817 domain-containing protein [Alphaproteobacteria bacterium]
MALRPANPRWGRDETTWLRALAERAGSLCTLSTLAEVPVGRGETLPVLGLVLGCRDPTAPTLGLFGGVHGLERVGTHTVLSYLDQLVEKLSWDRDARARLEDARIVAVPLVNPGGMAQGRRSNPRGVDLMRNAPVDATLPPPFLLGGHRLGPWLPWYRGRKGVQELEARAVEDFVRVELFPARAALSLDVHSGFGFRDRLWYPYARQVGGFPRMAEVRRLAGLLERTAPHHIYVVEPQSNSYTTHGDLWDHLFDQHVAERGEGTPWVPWTLEMGSWQWVRKNPRQALQRFGAFNPVLPHRYARVMRRHVGLIDLMLSWVRNPEAWAR